MTDYGTTVGLEGCFILTQRTNRHTLIIPFHILRRCERKQQMDRNNRGRGWRSPVSAFTPLPLLSTSHAQTDRYVNAHIWTHASAHTDTRDTHWIETSDPFDCRHWVLSYKRKTAREIRFFGGDGGGGGGAYERLSEADWMAGGRWRRRNRKCKSVKRKPCLHFSMCKRQQEKKPCFRFNLGLDANNTQSPASTGCCVHRECVCVFVFVHAGVGAAEGLVAREILTYRAPLPAALSLASTSRRKRSAAARLIYNLSLLFFPTCLSLFLLPLSSFVCIKVIWFSAKNAYWSLY